MVEDISKKTVLVLVILAIVVSVLGTLMVFSAVQQHDADYAKDYSEYYTHPAGSAQVSLSLVDSAMDGSQTMPTSGQVTLKLV